MVEKFSFKNGHRGRTIFRIFNSIFMVLMMITMLVPVLKVLSDSFDASTNYGIRLFPANPTIVAYEKIFTMPQLFRPFLISLYTTAVGTAIALALTTIAAYILIQKEMPGRKLFVSLIMFTMIFEGGLIPTYLTIRNLGLYNSLWAVILPLGINVYNTILMKNFFEQIPESLTEAAEIDGCSPFGIFIKIILPLSLPALASIGLFFAVAYYNEFFHFVIYITDSKLYNFQIKIKELVLDSSNMASQSNNDALYQTTLKNAAIIVSMIPPMLIYPFCQKYFVQGLTMGAVKE